MTDQQILEKAIQPWIGINQSFNNYNRMIDAHRDKLWHDFLSFNTDIYSTHFFGSDGADCENVYVALDGTIRPHLNPTKGLYYFDGQIFYRKRGK